MGNPFQIIERCLFIEKKLDEAQLASPSPAREMTRSSRIYSRERVGEREK